MTSPHAQRQPPHPLLLGLVACTLLLAGVGVVVWRADPARPAPAVTSAAVTPPVVRVVEPVDEPEPPSALWDAERMENLVLEKFLKVRRMPPAEQYL